MKKKLEMLLEELQYLKGQGVTSVYCEDSTLENLKLAVQSTIPALLKHQIETVSQDLAVFNRERDEHTLIELPEGNKELQWNVLRDKVLNCSVCRSHVKLDKKIVFGVGNLDADIFFCGEAPGAEEEIQGEPFVGKAGQLLTKVIQAMGLQREEVYIGNIMNWRPEMPTPYGNRPPTQEEMAFCLPYLKAQVAIVKPKVIIALGATAVNGLLGPDNKRRMGEIRGKWFEFQGVPLMVTFHPSYLLRNDTSYAKRQVWEDMLKVMEQLHFKISDKQRKFFQ